MERDLEILYLRVSHPVLNNIKFQAQRIASLIHLA